MIMTTVSKNKCMQLNDNKFYFPNGVVSLSFHRPCLAKINDFKQKKNKRFKNTFGKKKNTCYC